MFINRDVVFNAQDLINTLVTLSDCYISLLILIVHLPIDIIMNTLA